MRGRTKKEKIRKRRAGCIYINHTVRELARNVRLAADDALDFYIIYSHFSRRLAINIVSFIIYEEIEALSSRSTSFF
jgi:hypothetical protein